MHDFDSEHDGRELCVPTCRWTPARVYELCDNFSCLSFPHDSLYWVKYVAAENVRDVLVMVHAYFTQLRRRSIIDATEVVGMKLVALIKHGGAIAVNYSMTRRMTTCEVHMIDDSSAAATRATLVAFHSITVPAIDTSTKTESIAQIIFLGSGFDTLASGTELTRRIQTALEAKVTTNVKSESIDRPYAELARGTERVKAISSVGAEVNPGVEGLDAMNGTGAGLADVESPIIHGGNTHVQFVPTVVKNAIGSAKLATNVDPDKAYKLWAAFHGASLSRQFGTKPVKVQDAVVRVVYLCHTTENRVGTGTLASSNCSAPIGAATGLGKTSTVKHKQDLTPSSDSRSMPISQPSSNVSTPQYTILSVKAVYNKLPSAERPMPPCILLYSTPRGKIESLFSGDFFRDLDTDSSSVSPSEETKVEGELKKPVEKLPSSEITPSLEPVITKPVSLEEEKAGRKRLIPNASASTKCECERRFNGLEGSLDHLRCLLSHSEQSPFDGFSTGKDRAKNEEVVSAGMIWLDEHGSHANAKRLWAKCDAIEAMKPTSRTATGKPKLDLKRPKTYNKPCSPLKSSFHQPKNTAPKSTRSVPCSNPNTRASTNPRAEFAEKQIEEIESLVVRT
ncbi:Heat shock protein 88 [Rhizoctonia solani]|uniref:Heat shock protein 88 n=1 Tax=Rhizoctonia solani TaxID=456999 RepID=A0A0K6GDP0_9AGAM|nr:Heat shock protein 88 [Rhizoctonia solani]